MAAQFIQEGDAIDYVAPADVTNGTVVDLGGSRAGIANGDILAGQTGSLQVEGAIEAPHNGGAVGVDGQLQFDYVEQDFDDYVSGPSFRVNADTGRTEPVTSNPILRASMNKA